MSIFNPDVKEVQEGSYFGFSKPIDQPEGNKTLGVALKGVGETLEVAAKGIDATVKAHIEDKVYKAVDAERDQYTQVLNSTKSAATGIPVEDPAHESLVASKGKPPQYVDESLRFMSKLQSASEGGNISPTNYYARLNALAKDMRAQFPGWRDYIDTKVSEITGINPANAYITSITHDINQATSKASGEREKTTTFIRQNMELTDAPAVYQLYTQGKMTEADVMKWAAPQMKHKYDMQVRDLERKEKSGKKEDIQVTTAEDLTKDAGTQAINSFNSTVNIAGIASGSQIGDIITKAATGQLPSLTDSQAQQLGSSLIAQKKAFEAKIWKEWNTPDLVTKRTKVMDLKGGADEALKIIASQSKLYDLVADAIFNKDAPQAMYHQMQAERIMGDNRHKLYTDQNIGDYLTTLAIFNKDGGPEFAKEWYKHGLMSGANKKVQEWAENVRLGFATQGDLRNGGAVKTLLGAVEAAKAQKIRDAQGLTELVKTPATTVISPKTPDPIKINVARAAFTPEDNGLLNRFERDGFDPVTNKMKQGRNSIFNSWVNPAMSKEMKRISDTYGMPEVWDRYKNWSETNFASDIFSPEINDLHAIQMRGDLQLTWDTENKRFKLDPIPGKITPYTDYHGRDVAQRSIHRLNAGLYGIKSIAESEGGDVDAYVLNLLVGMGYNPTQGVGTNIPEAMVNSIAQPRIRELMQKKAKEQKAN